MKPFNNDPNLPVAVITGAGDQAFCVGSDLKYYATEKFNYLDSQKGYEQLVQRYINKPVIAAVNDHAVGGGLEIALACDLIIASEKAEFGLPEVKHGLIAGAGGLLRLPRQIPLKLALEVILTGESFSAEIALKWGLVNRVAARGSLIKVAISLAEKICKNGPLAIRISKDVVYKGLDATLDHPPTA